MIKFVVLFFLESFLRNLNKKKLIESFFNICFFSLKKNKSLKEACLFLLFCLKFFFGKKTKPSRFWCYCYCCSIRQCRYIHEVDLSLHFNCLYHALYKICFDRGHFLPRYNSDAMQYTKMVFKNFFSNNINNLMKN